MTPWTKVAAMALVAMLGAVPGRGEAGVCQKREFEGQGYAVCRAEIGQDLRMFLTGADGEILGSFDRLGEALAKDGRKLVFAMNAGMYHPNRQPVGLFVAQRSRITRLVTRAGPGNFGMLPNGVFCIAENGFSVVESRRFERESPDCLYASQSGPMLVIDNALHPKFLAGSESRRIRNGVGVTKDGRTALFVMSDSAVNFFDFARFFRDVLHLPEALYFDGNISRLYAPEIGRDDFGFQMGPMVALSEAAD
jgi:uncharacterized protein YigE (DUF2233 family)